MTIIAVANVLVLFSIAFMLWRSENSSIRKAFWPAFVFKLLCGIALGLLYQYYYTVGDTFSYYEDGMKLSAMARDNVGSYVEFLWKGNREYPIWHELNFQRPRALYMSMVTSIFCLLGGDDYWIVSLHLSFLVFLSAWYLVKQIIKLHTSIAVPAILAFLFLPSAVFWCSGLIKESLAMTALYFLAAIFLRIWQKERVFIVQWLAIPLALWVLWNLKYYYLAVLLPVAATTLLMKLVILPRITMKRWYIKVLTWSVVFIAPLYIASQVHPNFYPERFLHVIVENYQMLSRFSSPEDQIEYTDLQPEASSILYHAPNALLSGLFRPFVWEAHTASQWLVAMENLALLVLTIAALTRFKRVIHSQNRLLVFTAIVYIVLLCIFLSLSTPNFGTLSRYKVGFQSFFFLLIACNNPIIDRLKLFIQRLH
jgi:hypothetical protein